MNYPRKPLGLAVLLVQSAVAAPATYAQLEEIIVTAERREASLQETDISITAFSASTLSELGVSNYLDLADHAPNVMMHDMPGKSGGAISIRGFKNAETISSFEPKVGLYLDGVLIAKGAGSVIDVIDLERVEILRGPQGTLYGRNTAGGAVNFITSKPSYELGGKLSATFGRFDQQDYKATINVPLVADTLALKATVASLNRDGYYNNTQHDQDLTDKDRDVAHVQMKWDPRDDLSVLYSYDYTDIDESPFAAQLVNYNPVTSPELAPWVADGGSTSRNFDQAGTFAEAEVDGHSVTVNWNVNDNLSLVSITSLRSFDVESLLDADGSPVFVADSYAGDDVETFTQELRLVGSALDQRLEYVVGGFYMDEDLKDIYTRQPLAPFGVDALTRASAQNDIWAVFGEATYSLTDKLDVTFGLRYTEEDKSMNRTDSVTLLASGAALPDTVFPEAQRDFDDLSGTVSLSYKWNDDAMTYLKVSKGYVSGGFNPRAPTTDFAYFTDGYDEETLYNYELGWKTTWLENRLQVNGAVFYIDYEDLQVNQLTPSGRNNIDNAGDAEIKGAELEVVALLSEGLEVGGGYGYLDPEYKTYVNSEGQDLSGNHWAHAPENTVNAYARYVVPDFQSLGDLSFRVDWSWVDDHFLLTENSPGLVDGNKAPSYDFVNARVTLDKIKGPRDSEVRVSLWGKNLTDEIWYTSGYDLSTQLGIVVKAVAPPRTYGVDLSIEF